LFDRWPVDLPEALLVIHPPNLKYLFDFRGSTAVAVVASGEAVLLVDSRYLELARRETSDCTVHLCRDPLAEDLRPWLEKYADGNRIGVEERTLSFDAALRLQSWGFHLYPSRDLLRKQRAIKEAVEIDILEKAARLAAAAFDRFLAEIPWGETEIRAAGLLEYECRRSGSEGSSFATIVAAGRNSSLPHAQTGTGILDRKENLLIDFGVMLDSYCSDSTRMIVPPAQTEIRRIEEIVKEAQLNAIASVRPGCPAREIDAAARRVIIDSGFGEAFGHSTGHGLGLEVHELPFISARSEEILEEGMVFTVEPGIYLPGKFGVRLESTVQVTSSGCRIIG